MATQCFCKNCLNDQRFNSINRAEYDETYDFYDNHFYGYSSDQDEDEYDNFYDSEDSEDDEYDNFYDSEDSKGEIYYNEENKSNIENFNPNQWKLIAFSGGIERARITTAKGGRTMIARELGKIFPQFEFSPTNAVQATDLILIPNSINEISPTKKKQSNHAQVMIINNFLILMNRPDLIEKLKIVQNKYPRLSKTISQRKKTRSSSSQTDEYLS